MGLQIMTTFPPSPSSTLPWLVDNLLWYAQNEHESALLVLSFRRSSRQSQTRPGLVGSDHETTAVSSNASKDAALYKLTLEDNALRKGWHMPLKKTGVVACISLPKWVRCSYQYLLIQLIIYCLKFSQASTLIQLSDPNLTSDFIFFCDSLSHYSV